MTESFRIGLRSGSAWSIILVGLIAGCHVTEPALSFVPSPFVLATDSFTTNGAETESIYNEVLRFYRPSGGRVRWFDRILLPRDSADQVVEMMDFSLASHLVAQRGRSFCLLEERQRCEGDAGGELRVSRIYRPSPDWARVAIRFKGVEPYGAATENLQVFLLERVQHGWKIRGRDEPQ